MNLFTHPAARAASAAATLLGAIVLASPLFAASGEVLPQASSQEAMTARFVPLKPETLSAIIEKAGAIKGIGDIFMDVTHKPPATIEWE